MTASTTTALSSCAERLAHRLVVTLVNLKMHVEEQVSEDVAALIEDLGALAPACAPDPVRLVIGDEHLRFGNQPLLHSSLQAGRLLRLCHERAITAISFHPGLADAELLRFLQLLTDAREQQAFTPSHVEAALKSRGISNLDVELSGRGDRRPGPAALGAAPQSGGEIRHYQAMADVLHDNHVAGFRGDNLEVGTAAGVVEQTISQLSDGPPGLLALAMHDNIDQFTVGHSVRVTLLALQVAHHLQAARQDLLRVGTAALFHDIGKSRIPQHILFKQAALDDDERRIMATHARLGGELLIEHGDVDSSAVGAAFCHHMGPRGAGYPDPTIPFEPSGISRLVRVCDVFEALTSVRPYKRAMSPLEAYSIMFGMKDSFDPRWLRTFIQCIGLYPAGSHITLDSGEEAVVTGAGPSLRQPRARLLSGNSDRPQEFTVGVPEEGVTRHIADLPRGDCRDEGHAPADHGCGCDVDAALRPTTPD